MHTIPSKQRQSAAGLAMATRMAATALVLAGLAGCGGGSQPATPDATKPVRQWGYITLPDGNRMRYTVLLPSGSGRYPLLVEYDGYTAGSDPWLSKPWLAEGYAVMGLSIPGTGCSSGEDQVFDASVGAAGAFAIEWAARQNWSNGRVGMVGSSYSGFSQLWVAAQRPSPLLAISPSKNIADPYRDVAYPGGIRNSGFPSLWWGGFPAHWKQAAKLAADIDGDTECAKTAADNIEKIKRPDLDLLNWLKTPYFEGLYIQRSAMYVTHRIDIPTLGTQSWQDEQVGTRMGYYEDTIAPEKMWLISSNGDHSTDLTTDYLHQTKKRFFARFVKGQRNGFENEPHVHLLQELQKIDTPDNSAAASFAPAAVSLFDRLPLPVQPMRLWLQAGGSLTDSRPSAAHAATSYQYPTPGTAVNAAAANGWENAKAPDGQLIFTTAPLPQDLSFHGEGSADLWLSATAADTDLQVTVSEVRPDAMEMFVQRGWLRASMRKLDESRSTELRPWADLRAQAAQPLAPGQPTAVRIEIQKFAHVFRKGSSIRVTIDSPSPTGYWFFESLQTPSTNTIWHDSARASSIVLGYLPYAHKATLASCGKTLSQPCRPNAAAAPAGVGPRAPS